MIKVKLLEFTPNPEKVVAAAAKLCYSSVGIEEITEGLDEETTSKFIKMLNSYGHNSPMEHVSFTFGIEGVSRSLTHQLVRHRVASYSQQSQRYVKLDAFEYIIPPSIAKDEKCKAIFIEAMRKDQEDYDKLVEVLKVSNLDVYIKEHKARKKCEEITEKELKSLKSKAEKSAIEDARYVFPNACATKIVVTMNARELMHFFSHRCCTRAQWEIRDLADAMVKEVKKVAPNLFDGCGPSCVKGNCSEGAMTCGNAIEIRSKYLSI